MTVAKNTKFYVTILTTIIEIVIASNFIQFCTGIYNPLGKHLFLRILIIPGLLISLATGEYF
jgi:hypothetical protein